MDKLDYLNPNSKLSLKQGIIEMRTAELNNDMAENISVELARDIDEHDAIHVLFGCSTNLNGEILAHIWTIWGTTMKFKQMHEVNLKEDHKAALKQIGHFKLLCNWFFNFPKIFIIFFYSRKMNKKFPVDKFEQYLDKSLFELRKIFNIKLIA